MNLTQTVQTMSSLEIAELTGKSHNDVLKDIRRILAEAEIGEGEFSRTYLSSQNKELPCFHLPRRECDLVVSGYSVKYRLAIIDRWQELEAQQSSAFPIPQTLSEALLLAGKLAAEKEAALAQIEADKPKVEFAMAVRNLDGSCLMREFAKVIGTGEKRLFKRLRDEGYLMANNQPYQRFVESGLFVVVEGVPFTDSNGKSHPTFTTRLTGKGQVFFEKKFRTEDAKPVLALVV